MYGQDYKQYQDRTVFVCSFVCLLFNLIDFFHKIIQEGFIVVVTVKSGPL